MHGQQASLPEQVSMLSFDIETEGLNKRKDRITVAAVYDPERGVERCYNFLKGTDKEIEAEMCGFLEELDNADTLCSFNGARCSFNKQARPTLCRFPVISNKPRLHATSTPMHAVPFPA